MALKVENKGSTADLYLLDEIGAGIFGGVSSKEMAEALESVKNSSKINLHINSPGGDFFDGLAIYNLLKRYRQRLTCSVEGLAASAASFIALAGSRLEMAESSWLMIHDAHAVVAGNADGMREMAATLDGFSQTIAEIYAAKTKKPVAEMREAMKAETWLDGAQAVDFGLADGIAADLKIAASIDLHRYPDAPEALRKFWAYGKPAPDARQSRARIAAHRMRLACKGQNSC